MGRVEIDSNPATITDLMNLQPTPDGWAHFTPPTLGGQVGTITVYTS